MFDIYQKRERKLLLFLCLFSSKKKGLQLVYSREREREREREKEIWILYSVIISGRVRDFIL